jgi:peptidoglycan/xylan/chitin deacetylase (PgdA/CDA1 family)
MLPPRRLIHRVLQAVVLAALGGLLAILLARPAQAQSVPPSTSTFSSSRLFSARPFRPAVNSSVAPSTTFTSPLATPVITVTAVPKVTAVPTPVSTPEPTPTIPPFTPAPSVAGEKVMYLTFDDGPNGVWTQQMLDVLAEFNARATFFIVGVNAEGNDAILRKVHDAGHGLANHSYTHYSLKATGFKNYAWEINTTSALLGDMESKCFRPPYGHVDGNTEAFAEELGYEIAMWNIDPQDWRLPGSAAIANNVIANARPNGVVVLHDGGGERAQTVAAVRTILATLQPQGYVFKALCRDAPMPELFPTTEEGGMDDLSYGSESGTLGQGSITFPAAGAVVSGLVLVQGTAAHPDFEKWQLDLMINGADPIFLNLGEEQMPEVGRLFVWDTRRFPDGGHMLRLRVVHSGGNYDEYFAHVTVQN